MTEPDRDERGYDAAMRNLAAAAAAAALVSSGCSLLFIEKPPQPPIQEQPVCSASWGWVVVDVVLGGLSLGVGAIQVTDNDESNNAYGAANILIAVPFVVGTIVGESRVKGCKAARREWRESEESATTDEVAPPLANSEARSP